MLDIHKYKSSLLAFLQLVESLNQAKSLVAEHLRYPAFAHSTLVGSEFGRDLWEQPASKKLIGSLLEDDDLGRWFTPPPDSALNELRSQLASLVAAWESRSVAPQQFVAECADPFLRAVRNNEPACSAVRILYGIEVTNRVELAPGLALEPGSPQRLKEAIATTGGLETDALRLLRRPSIFVAASNKARRDEMGPFAATMAWAWTLEVMTENVRWAVWLVTGVLPRLGDAYAFEHSEFPIMPLQRYPASLRETHAHAMDREDALVDSAFLCQVYERMAVVRGEDEAFPEQVMLPLWVANNFIPPAIDATDRLLTVVLAYAATDGLLLRKGDHPSRLGPRLALLIQRDKQEGRRLRRAVKRWGSLRDFGAHGERPPVETVQAFSEDASSIEPWADSLAGDPRIWYAAGSRAANLFRRVFLAMLFCCVTISDHACRPGLTRDDIVGVLDRAAAGDDIAERQIASIVPKFVRDIEL